MTDIAAKQLAFQDKELLEKKAIINTRIDTYVRKTRKKFEKTAKERNSSLRDMVANAPTVSDEMIEELFSGDITQVISDKAVKEIRRVLMEMQRRVNKLPPIKRLFVLETVDFFNNQLSVRKLIPTILVLKGEAQKKAVCELIFPTFLGINRNIEILVNDKRLFDAKQVHTQRGALYALVFELSEFLMKLFNKRFINDNRRYATSLEFLINAFEPTSFLIQPSINSDQKYIYNEFVSDEGYLGRVLLRFVVLIQSHQSLYIYALKQTLYYKYFLLDLTKKHRFKTADSFDISRILAGCFISNEQLAPPRKLIDGMLDNARYALKESQYDKRLFLKELSPGNVQKVINQFRMVLRQVYNNDLESEFFGMNKFSLQNIVRSAFKAIVSVVERSIEVMSSLTRPVAKIFQKVRDTYVSAVHKDEIASERIKSELTAESDSKEQAKKIPELYFPKNIESFATMTQHFKTVKTNVIAFRGEIGGSYKDYALNKVIFGNNSRIEKWFLTSFYQLMEATRSNKNTTLITREKLPNIKEFDLTHMFDKYLISLGVSHMHRHKTGYIDEQDLFPYVILFKRSVRSIPGRIESRTVVVNDRLRVYNPVELTKENLKLVHEALYLIFHLLPEKQWSSAVTQKLIVFLLNSLQKRGSDENKLMYCVDFPEPIEL